MYKIVKLFNTIIYLKFTQIYYRIYYIVRNKLRRIRGFTYPLFIASHSESLSLKDFQTSIEMIREKNFSFLNLSHTFNNSIDWNFFYFGKLWTYNLSYFEYLHQKGISQESGLALIDDFINQTKFIEDGMEPYPISLRGINWIKFLTKYQIKNQKIDDSLYAQYKILMDNIEYHLLGNHLLENAFSLLYGAYYFKDDTFYTKAKEILTAELNEQVLEDGAHFELSPMYHQIILFRVLDCINLVQNNNWKKQVLLALLIDKAELMLGWINTITFENGNIPLLNDSTNKIAPTTQELNEYASTLKINMKNLKFSDCGYRKIENEYYEMLIDVGNIGPDYIPGHAHSDTFNFELYVKGKPLIVDTGLSTYETNIRRTFERSTSSHNTVTIDGKEQSEVWGAFRVARRAKITQLKENANIIEATHDGYKRIGALHTRKFLLEDNYIIIEDHIDSTSVHECIACLHFYPGIEPEIKDTDIIVNDLIIKTENAKLKVQNYSYASEFNTLKDAKMVLLQFTNTFKMEITL